MNILDLPNTPGTYILLMRLDTPATLRVGRLGASLPAGLYAYVGSAHGPGGLCARIRRHLRPDKATHWHIDALTALASVVTIWLAESPVRLECAWAHTLATTPGVTTPIPGFGSSDCTCHAHLFAMSAGSTRAVWEALDRPATIPDVFT
jgi:Uri superfamily endonuclease